MKRERSPSLRLRQVIARNVRAYRMEKGLTQEQVCQKSRLAPQYLSRLEKSMNENITVDNLEKIATGLEVPVAELVSPGAPAQAPKEVKKKLKHAINLLTSVSAQIE